ncbi:MAG: hypothetical protein EOS04_35685 [Mesorhizobium sp.]|nr:MAG: hypothetical protein EOS02_27495 [Mesorhizobium sp.]RWN78603.1 MAG: hypothetical protein EOS04_35685 [Mesorhizobium sp.]
MSEFDGLLEDLKMNRTSLMDSMIRGKGWTLDQVRDLAEMHGAISAVQAVIAEGPTRDEYNPANFRPVGTDGYPK